MTIRETLKLPKGANLGSHRTYRIWKAMKSRCNWKGHEAAARYSNVKVCERWNSFLDFFNDMGHPPSDSHSLDRIDPYGNYAPSNCRWATAQVQSENKRNNIIVLIDGVCVCAKKASKMLGINYHTLLWRLRNNKPLRGVQNA